MQYFSNATASKIVKLNEQPGCTTATLTDERSHQSQTRQHPAAHYIQMLQQRGYHSIDAGKYAALRAVLGAEHRFNLPSELGRQVYAQLIAA